MQYNLATNTESVEYTFMDDIRITRLACGGNGQYYVAREDNTVTGLRTGFEPFTTQQIQSKKLIGFEQPIQISHPIPIIGVPDFESLGTYAQYSLEIRDDGIYTMASSTGSIPGDGKIKFNGVFLLH